MHKCNTINRCAPVGGILLLHKEKTRGSSYFLLWMCLYFYELTGIIGREMLADKHITGSGEGYQNVVFGKDSKDSLIVNIQYNVFAPIIYMLLIAAALQYLK